jgi:hypothetical protein
MSQSNRRMVAGVIVAGAALLLFGRSGTVGAQHAGGVSHWVKVGHYRINGDNINYVRDEDESLVIHFGFGTTPDRISLKGAEAEAMRRWLDVRADDPMNAGKSLAPPPK